ncbi:MAG TPA: hypothetical protein VFI23_10665 [Rhizomicrobium sp.]|nr:hypothetical protein [Rhizomicrobium sp.]
MFTSAKWLSLCGVFFLSAPVMAQTVDQAATADPAPLTQSDGARASDQPAEAPNLGQGTKAQAEHSAEATAHKSLNDPDNQLGTSLQGRTRPVVEASGSQNNSAAAGAPSQASAE